MYLKISNSNEDYLDVVVKDILINNVSVYNSHRWEVSGASESIINEPMDYTSTIKDLIGSSITSLRIEYTLNDEGNTRIYEVSDLNYTVKFTG